MWALQAAGRASSPIHAPNQWPRQRPSFDAALRVYVDRMLAVGRCLMRGASTASSLQLQALSALRLSLTPFVRKKSANPSMSSARCQVDYTSELLTTMLCRCQPHWTMLRYRYRNSPGSSGARSQASRWGSASTNASSRTSGQATRTGACVSSTTRRSLPQRTRRCPQTARSSAARS